MFQLTYVIFTNSLYRYHAHLSEDARLSIRPVLLTVLPVRYLPITTYHIVQFCRYLVATPLNLKYIQFVNSLVFFLTVLRLYIPRFCLWLVTISLCLITFLLTFLNAFLLLLHMTPSFGILAFRNCSICSELSFCHQIF